MMVGGYAALAQIACCVPILKLLVSAFEIYCAAGDLQAGIAAFKDGDFLLGTFYVVSSVAGFFSAVKTAGQACFTGDTLVAVEEGQKRIDEIEVGDKVWSYNVETGETELKTVTKVYVHLVDEILHLYTDEGDIDTTSNHPFYVISKGWVAAGDLVVSDEVYNLDETTSTILGYAVEILDEPVLVYNLEVEDFHSYFVGCVPILVHYKTCWKTKLIMCFCATPKIWDFGGDSHFSAIMEVFMGNWGAGIFQNDISDDVKTDYKNKLKMGKSDEVALQEILSENSEFLDDAEDKFDFWFGLSSVMSDLGRLTEEVRNIAVGLIDRGGDVFRFEDDKSELKKRKAELEKLRNKLVGEQPERKRIPVVKAFLCPWKPNDILIYTLDSECFKDKPYFNKFIVLLVDEIVNYDVDIPLGDMLPITYLKICDDYPNSVEDINNSPFIPQRFIFYLNNPKKNKLEREHRFMWYRDGFKKQSSRFELWGNYEFTRPYNKPWTYPSIKDLRDFHTTIACMLNRFDEYIIESLDFYKDDL